MDLCGLYAVPDVQHGQFCGPTAIAALTRCPVVKVEDVVLAHRKLHPPLRRERMPEGTRVKTMWGTEIEAVFADLGFRATVVVAPQIVRDKRPLWRVLAGLPKDKPLLVLISGHFIAVRGGMFVDRSNTEPRPLAGHRFSRCRVVCVWTITEARS